MRATAVFASISFAACTGPLPEKTTYLLIGHEARSAGVTLEYGEWSGAPVLPISADVDVAVYVRSAGERTKIDVRPESVGQVLTDGRVEWSKLGSDVIEDAFVVEADASAARSLSARLGSELNLESEGRWHLSAPQIWDRASFMEAPDGVTEVEPTWVDPFAVRPAQVGGGKSASGVGPVAGDLEAAPQPPLQLTGFDEVTLVGAYFSCNGELILNAAGGFELTSAHGTTKGQFFRNDDSIVLMPDEGLHTFTAMKLRDDGALDDGDITWERP